MARREDGGATANGVAAVSAAGLGRAARAAPLGPAAPCRAVLSPPPGLEVSLRCSGSPGGGGSAGSGSADGEAAGCAGLGVPRVGEGTSREERGRGGDGWARAGPALPV